MSLKVGNTNITSVVVVDGSTTTNINHLYYDSACRWVRPFTITIKISDYTSYSVPIQIYRSSNSGGEEPSATYSSSSYVIDSYANSANGKTFTGYFGDVLYVKANSYTSGSYKYSVSSSSYTVNGTGTWTITITRTSVGCSTCSNSSSSSTCNMLCSNSAAGGCEITSGTSSTCLN